MAYQIRVRIYQTNPNALTRNVLFGRRDNVTPAFIVVHAKDGDNVLSTVGKKAKCTTSATGVQVEDILITLLRRPLTATPDGLLDDAEICVWVGLEDADANLIGHFMVW